jgi:hypothetical protein
MASSRSHQSIHEAGFFPSSGKDKSLGEEEVERLVMKHVERRQFIRGAGLAAITGVASTAVPSLAGSSKAEPSAQFENSESYLVRHSAHLRAELAENLLQTPIPAHPTNGDELLYPNYIGDDTRGFAHYRLGEVDPNAYRLALKAYASGDPKDFEAIPLAGTRKQPNPIGSLAVNLSGLSEAQFAVPSPHTLAGQQRAAEAVEIYWQALLRDVPFTEYRDDTSHQGILVAVEELNKLHDFYGPRLNRRVTPSTLFRGTALYVNPSDPSNKTGKHVVPPGVLAGPYVSQFLLHDVPYEIQATSAKVLAPTSDSEFLTNYAEWLLVQNGNLSGRTTKFLANPRYISTGRDFAQLVHGNNVAFSGAALLLASPTSGVVPGFNTPLNPSNPYVTSKTQAGGTGTFGLGYFQSLLNLGVSRAIRAAYWQQTYVHRTLRPEAYGGLVHIKIANNVNYPIHDTVLNSTALALTFKKYGTYLLPQAYPEGAPLHPSYPSGAAITAAVSVTLLKAFFDETAIIPNPVQPHPNDPTKLIPYEGEPLTVGGELNKLAAHYAIARAWAGIHWRSDVAASLALGEAVAISLLSEESATFREKFNGFTFTRFDGTNVVA